MDSFSSAPMNVMQYDPELRDLMDLVSKEVMLSFNCHAIATVKSFDPATQTVTATINYTKTFYRKNSATNSYTPVQVQYPPLVKCPVYILGDGADCSLTFPIKAGATCSLLFHDRDISAWFASGQIGPLPSNEMHAFADAVALIGVRSLPKALSGYDTNRAVLQNGDTMVGVGASKVLIQNELNGSLGVNLQALLVALQTFMSACAGSTTDPVLAAAATAFASATATAITNIEGILE